jgi:sulfur carrier protein
MKLIVNGETIDYGGVSLLTAFLKERGADPARVAVLVNDEVVPRAKRSERMLAEGDRVEILTFAGGG